MCIQYSKFNSALLDIICHNNFRLDRVTTAIFTFNKAISYTWHLCGQYIYVFITSTWESILQYQVLDLLCLYFVNVLVMSKYCLDMLFCIVNVLVMSKYCLDMLFCIVNVLVMSKYCLDMLFCIVNVLVMFKYCLDLLYVVTQVCCASHV